MPLPVTPQWADRPFPSQGRGGGRRGKFQSVRRDTENRKASKKKEKQIGKERRVGRGELGEAGHSWCALPLSGRRGHPSGRDRLSLGCGRLLGRARLTAPAQGRWAPPPGGCAAAPRRPAVLGSSHCSACGAGRREVVREGRSADRGVEGAVRVVRLRLRSRTLRLGFLTWACRARSPRARLRRPPAAHGRPDPSLRGRLRRSLPSSQSARSPSRPQQLGGGERPPAASGRRLGAPSPTRGAAIWSLGGGRGEARPKGAKDGVCGAGAA